MLLVGPSPRYRVLELPPGVVEVRSEILVDGGTEVRGHRSGTVLRLAAGFPGRAAIVVRGGGVRIHDLTVEGDAGAGETAQGLPPYDVPFARFTRSNGVFAEGVAGLTVERVRFRRITGMAILASRCSRVTIAEVEVIESGGRNAAGRNNTTGGILLEEGTLDFRVIRCRLADIRGNGIWTHSLYTSPRNGRGLIEGNEFRDIGRDAIQVGHAYRVRIEGNHGARIGFPVDAVDIEGRAIPVAIDTAGDVDHSTYAQNRFEEIDGKCIDLDGFHDGTVTGNACINRGRPEDYPFGGYAVVMNNSNRDMRSQNIVIAENTLEGPKFGGIFVIGTGHRIERNRLLNLNIAHCNEEAARFGCYYAPGEPDLLSSGIYLGRGAERPDPARGNIVRENLIAGFQMKSRCIGYAPGIERDWNTIEANECR